ncbi:glycerate kinase type-2 family protein [Aliiglaciecola lipolytica]|uniref:glycerate kinase type-2 family protein n=1 Tax=Aliiglaciecola lipolytica TaxID=477689 RepID=UPI001C090F93|nr:glycerate kinase [Aliiglaciecola lipolytica]MBU2877356.1 glycerate kinase [Aliiglaciecola lipolytica]
MNNSRAFLFSLFETAVHACLPSVCLDKHLDHIDTSRGVCVIGAGKASADMAAAVFKKYGDACYGKVVTRYGYGTELATGNIEILYASHPVPDKNSLLAGKALLELVAQTPPDIPIIFLISGGGSALMSIPVEGVSFADKMELHRFLLRSGASIDEMNVVRKQLSAVKGGKLAEAAKSISHTYVISDVVGDDPSLIASGPTVKDNSTAELALTILEKYNWQPIDSIYQFLTKAIKSKCITPPSNTSHYTVVANAHQAIDAAVAKAKNAGWETHVLNYEQQGEASRIAKEHAAIALKFRDDGKKVLLFSGGELTVTIDSATGDGGPNQEYLLAMAIALDGASGISVLSCDSDGVDGSKDIAGGFIDESTLTTAKSKGLSPQSYLANHDSFHFLQAVGGLIITGPTRTNVNDFRVIMIN